MKNENENQGLPDGKAREGVKKRGFYTILYSCVGVMLIIAAAISFANTKAPKPESPKSGGYSANNTNDDGNTVEVAKNETKSYLAQNPLTDEDEFGNIPGFGAREPFNPPETPKPQALSVPPRITRPTAEPTAAKEKKPEEPAKTEPENVWVPQSFDNYTDADRMSWPVAGEIVMEFSTDRLVYDKTLDQYRTNDSISIAAAVGDEVKATADGIVTDIYSSREYGKTVVIDHGNGWSTRYSQLQETLNVGIGETVRAGHTLGTVGNPSIYTLALGSHLEFEITQNSEAVNPTGILSE